MHWKAMAFWQWQDKLVRVVGVHEMGVEGMILKNIFNIVEPVLFFSYPLMGSIHE
jgi:branched-subunit amino acid permease